MAESPPHSIQNSSASPSSYTTCTVSPSANYLSSGLDTQLSPSHHSPKDVATPNDVATPDDVATPQPAGPSSTPVKGQKTTSPHFSTEDTVPVTDIVSEVTQCSDGAPTPLLPAGSSVLILPSESSEVFLLPDPEHSAHSISISQHRSDSETTDLTAKSSSSSVLVLGTSHSDCRRPHLDSQALSDEDTSEDRVAIQQVQSMLSVSSAELLTFHAEEDVIPEGSSDPSPEGSSDLSPEGSSDLSPEGSSDLSPEGSSDLSPVSSGEAGMLISTCDTVIFNTNSLSNNRGLDRNGSAAIEVSADVGCAEVTDIESGACTSVAALEYATEAEVEEEYRGSGEPPQGSERGTSSETSGDEGITEALDEGLTEALDEGLTVALDEGLTVALDEGLTVTLDEGLTLALDEGLTLALDEGITVALDEGLTVALDEGLTVALDEGLTLALDEGITVALDEGITEALDEGLTVALDEGITEALDEELTVALDEGLTVALDEADIATLRTISPEAYHSQESSPVNNKPDYEATPSLASVNSQPNQYTTSSEYPEYPATDALLTRLQNLLRQEEVDLITSKQKTMLNKLECTNEKLMSFNELSECEHAKALLSFRHYTKLLLEMRRDVEMAFRRISSIKHKLASQYPAAWSAMAERSCTDFVHPDEEERLLELCTRDSAQCEGVQCERDSAQCDSVPIAPDQVSQDSFVVVGSYASSSARDGRLDSVEEDPEIHNSVLDESTIEGDPDSLGEPLEATHPADNKKISQFPHSPLLDNQECEEETYYELSDTSITQLNT